MESVDIKIAAISEQVDQAWLWKLCRDFETKVIVKKASVDEDFGWLLLNLEGSAEEIQRATAWLMTTGMHVEALTRALGA